jgi:hypothetical protein
MNKFNWLKFILFVFFTLPASAQNDTLDSPFAAVDTLRQDFGLFARDDILHLALRFDIREYIRKKPKDEYLNAILTYHINEKDSINKEIRIRSRGVFRNGYCAFPPLSLNFNKPDSIKSDTGRIGKIKVVTHCRYGNEIYLFKEYLVYKLFNILTEYSFRVRLARIDYISSTGKSKTISTYCFLIEPLNNLARRTNLIPVNSTTLSQKNIIPEMMDRVTIFNYMIGNTDWAVTFQHNCKVLTGNFPDKPGVGIAIPYDFDYSGLVDTYYAIPDEALGLESVRQRRYLGLCRPVDEYVKTLKEFVDKKPDFYKLINDFPYLNEKTKKSMVSYLEEFYSGIDKRNTIIQNFLNECSNF